MKPFTVLSKGLRRVGAGALAAVLLAGCASSSRPELSATAMPTVTAASRPIHAPAALPIEVRAGNVVVAGTLQDTAAARDFTAMLPVTLRMRDRFGQAIVGVLPRRLDVGPAVAGDVTGTVGQDAGPADEIAYWPGGGELAVFYVRGVPRGDLIRLGMIEAGLEVISDVRDATITVRRES